MGNRLKEKVAIVVGAGQQPGDTIGNGRATSKTTKNVNAKRRQKLYPTHDLSSFIETVLFV